MLGFKDKKRKKSEEPLPSTALFTDKVDDSNISIKLTSIQSAAGGYICEITNNSKKDIHVSRFCVNNFANAIRNTGVGRNFYGTIKAKGTKKFNISFVAYELSNRDPVLFNFLWHPDSIPLFVDENKKPFKITDIIRS
jgi:hypothetical protein